MDGHQESGPRPARIIGISVSVLGNDSLIYFNIIYNTKVRNIIVLFCFPTHIFKLNFLELKEMTISQKYRGNINFSLEMTLINVNNTGGIVRSSH